MYARCPPAWAAAVSLVGAMLGAWEEAQAVWTDRGRALETTTVRLSAAREAARARLEPQRAPAPCEDPVAGRRVVISSAGGRLRLRAPTRGPQTPKGRRRSPGAWRDPKGWSLDGGEAAGKRDARLAPVMDAPRQGPDAVVALLRTSVQRLAMTQADPWSWKRVPLLGPALGLTAAPGHARLDFSHTGQRLGPGAARRNAWRAKARPRWRTPQRHVLWQGAVAQGIAAMQGLCRGRQSTALRTHLTYCLRQQRRMASATLLALKLPSGSGAIESTVRRVVNLRLQGPSSCWWRARAEAILL